MTNVNKWSRTAATNSTVDSPINWAEGQNPSTVNDSARSVMAAVAADRDDTRGQLTSAGGTTAYTLTTNSVNASLQNGLEVSFKVNATSTGSVTLNVDGLGSRKVYDNGSSVSTQIGAGGFTINAHVTVQYDSAADTGTGGWIVTSNPGAASTAGFATTTGGSWAAEATVASAATTDILAASTYFVAISGTATITSLGTGANRVRFVRATGAFTLTHNATTLILPGAANITAASGDTFLVEADASSNARVLAYQRAAGSAIKAFTGDSGSGGALGLVPAPSAGDAAAGKFLRADGTFAAPTGKFGQVVSSVVTAVSTGTTLIPADDTIPQNTEGDQYLSLAITPASATSTLIISVNVNIANSVTNNTVTMALFQDTTANALAAVAQIAPATAGFPFLESLVYTMTSGTTSATTFKVRLGGFGAGTTTLNGVGGVRRYGGVCASTITITEILP